MASRFPIFEVRCWHLTDPNAQPDKVCFRGQNGHAATAGRSLSLTHSEHGRALCSVRGTRYF
jgi:hypothetical protein